MTALVHFAVSLLVSMCAICVLIRARWIWRAPTTAIVTWQLLVLTVALCLAGLPLTLVTAPNRSNMAVALVELVVGRAPSGLSRTQFVALLSSIGVTVSLGWASGATWLGAVRTRRRHRALLTLVARRLPGLSGVRVLDHPTAMAYCVPGVRPLVVISSGALSILTRDELAAVLAHEWAHARERHTLALLPFAMLRRLLPWSQAVRRVHECVATLLEMRADDLACRASRPAALAAALRRFSGPGSPGPKATLGIADTSIIARLERLTRPRPALPWTLRWLVVATAAALALTPVSFFVWP